MSNQPRVVKVLAALLFSMTIGAIVLMSLGQNPPAAGLWSLSKSLQSDSLQLPVEQLPVDSIAPQYRGQWNHIEVCLSGTDSGNIAYLASRNHLADPRDLNCHFVVCNGQGGINGQVQATEKWLRQRSLTLEPGLRNVETTIRICVVGDGKSAPTDLQIRQKDALVNELARRFDIDIEESVRYPKSLR